MDIKCERYQLIGNSETHFQINKQCNVFRHFDHRAHTWPKRGRWRNQTNDKIGGSTWSERRISSYNNEYARAKTCVLCFASNTESKRERIVRCFANDKMYWTIISLYAYASPFVRLRGACTDGLDTIVSLMEFYQGDNTFNVCLCTRWLAHWILAEAPAHTHTHTRQLFTNINSISRQNDRDGKIMRLGGKINKQSAAMTEPQQLLHGTQCMEYAFGCWAQAINRDYVSWCVHKLCGKVKLSKTIVFRQWILKKKWQNNGEIRFVEAAKDANNDD